MKRQTWLILCTYFLDVLHCYENIAIKKPAYQQNPYFPDNDTFAASTAVDGRRTNLKWNGGQCAVSASGQTATWWVNLTSIHSIHHITIYYMTNNWIWGSSSYLARSFLGFSVYVSNTTNRLQGILCFKDQNFSASTIPAVFNTTCNLIGQYVIYYNERLNNVTYPADYSESAESDLCEVEVYGCPTTGFYGSNCSNPCPDINCRYCHLEAGYCQGCKPGYQGHQCELICPRGFFGEGCADKCCDKCYGCNHINGLCDSGCKPGWRGDYCQEVCLHGHFGQDCAYKCNNTCKGCNNVNGLCDSGCNSGWIGDYCNQACSYGFFGVDCAKRCINTCAGCNNINGLCDYGCFPGWTGYFCNKVCPIGFFGQECAYRCNNTCKGCNNTNGLCDSGCNPGWKGDYCNEDCNKGSYGISCQEVCGQCRDVNQCLHINGTCLTGCSAGYQGTLCKETCNNGSFGNDCREHCESCRDNDCHHIHGTCLSGCIDGYQGDLCKTHCEKTFFGKNCSQKCNLRCLNQDCHHETGECVDKQKHNNLPTIIVLLGSIVAVAVLLITILFRRTRRKTLKLRTTTNKDDYEAQTSIQYLGQNRMQNLSTYCQKSNFEESRNLPSSLNMKCTHGKTSKKASNSNVFKDKNTFVNEKVHAGNQIDDVFQIKEHCTIDIDVTELGKVIEGNKKNDDSGFKKEYASLLYGDQYPCNIGKLPGNITKNRFKTILPYDHSRITLERKCSDYINANYIDGIGQENDYIATQGPKQNTVNDFWVMVWQEKVAQIVMLTNLVEETKTKCIQYWPDLEASMDCDILTLKTTEERRYAYYVIRRLNVKHRQKHENRTVTHYHFTAWPDHGVPDPICLLLFHNHVERTKRTSYGGPTIVHCSAGIGRTGTYIAVDALYKESQRNNKINIAEYVKDMREKRMNMVQTCVNI
nr:uncharacterized protein LOC105339512 [Crassostrea gigas]